MGVNSISATNLTTGAALIKHCNCSSHWLLLYKSSSRKRPMSFNMKNRTEEANELISTGDGYLLTTSVSLLVVAKWANNMNFFFSILAWHRFVHEYVLISWSSKRRWGSCTLIRVSQHFNPGKRAACWWHVIPPNFARIAVDKFSQPRTVRQTGRYCWQEKCGTCCKQCGSISRYSKAKRRDWVWIAASWFFLFFWR